MQCTEQKPATLLVIMFVWDACLTKKCQHEYAIIPNSQLVNIVKVVSADEILVLSEIRVRKKV